ncbi:glycosyltransferase family 39 protein [Formosa sp. PL04]|uniref:glycosyltransferase family 39 protein n=1 Tax=Formosa sp. PL04 TaxID=3081755 RepID=UPI0029812C83|nr:glycosyltransferase family 39 protein [Formosa sp. PL04]MDW5288305.1 glycosyltransferase family 39 protein [Formosa sp. PL04]
MNRQTKIVILFFCVLKLLLHLIADSHSGFQGDELLHIETGKHLAFGYMEFPPLIAVLAFIQNLLHSNSVFIHHLFSHLAALLIMIYVAKITLELGGKNTAVFLALLANIIAPGFGRSQQLFQPVVFSQLFWVLGFYQLLRFVKHLDKKSLWYLTLFCILGFSTKFDSIFFIFGMSSLFLFNKTRTALIKHKFWIHIIVFLLCITPNLIWQYLNDFPLLQMTTKLYETQLNKISRTENIMNLLVAINPIVSLMLITPAIILILKTKGNFVIRILSISIGLSCLLLLFKNGKSYYFFPLLLTLIPFGALFWEQKVVSKRHWGIYPITVIMLFGTLLIPFGMPIYSFNHYLRNIYPYEENKIQGGEYGIKYDEYYTQNKWEITMQNLKSVYDSLPNKERQNTLIWGKHYAQAGAVSLLGESYNLPKPFSYHGSFYSWSPTGKMPETVIALSYQVGDFFEPYFENVILVKSIYNPYADNEEELYQRIYICKYPKQNFDAMKTIFKNRVFE